MPRPHSASPAPTVALCVIARDEEELIGACLQSARPHVDEMIVLDTGSTDRTALIAAELGAQVHTYVWNDDFAAARNAAIEHATTDWVLMLDADEELTPESAVALRERLLTLPADFHGYSVLVDNRSRSAGSTSSRQHFVARLFPRQAEIRFVGAIHEDLSYLPNPSATRTLQAPDVKVLHFGYDAEIYRARGKAERNERLLLKSLADNPGDARTLYNLAQHAHVTGTAEAALGWIQELLPRIDTLPATFGVEAHRIWLDSLLTLGRSEEVDRVARLAEEADALSPEARELLADHDEQRGHFESARRHLLQALLPEAPRGLALNPGSGGWRTRLHVALLDEQLGEYDSALKHMELAYADAPREATVVIARQAAAFARRTRRYTPAWQWLERVLEGSDQSVDDYLTLFDESAGLLGLRPEADAVPALALDAAALRGDWQTAYESALLLHPARPVDEARLVWVARRLDEEGASEAALDVLSHALDSLPQSTHLYWLLVRVLKNLGRYEDAQMAVEVLDTLPQPVAA